MKNANTKTMNAIELDRVFTKLFAPLKSSITTSTSPK